MGLFRSPWQPDRSLGAEAAVRNPTPADFVTAIGSHAKAMKPVEGELVAAGILLMTRPTVGGGLSPQFLLMRHPDRWDLPKGHAESGESIVETALRETTEETGIAADRITLEPDFRFTLNYPVASRRSGGILTNKTVHYFLGWVDQPHAVLCSEHDGYRWFDWPPAGPIQQQTIDPLLAAVADHLKG